MNRLLGPSIQIDPSFPYYLNRSEQSIADELELAGYRVIHYFVTDETKVNQKLIEQLQDRGMAVWAMVLGNGAYTTEHLPKDWPDWQMVLLKPVNDGYFRFSPFSYKYTAWKKQALAELVRKYPFDGLEVAEPYFPEWNGLANGVYGDVGPYARAAFKQQYGSEIPDFKHRSNPNYYKNNPILYRQWIEFRVWTVNRFLFELFNAPGGVREARPDIRIATWSLGIHAGPDSVEKLREFQGLDAAAMISTVRPDVHFIQTHWPDWMRPFLKPDYCKHYEPFAAKIRAIHPHIPIGVQADIGSLQRMRRSRTWLNDFASNAAKLGYSTWTAYEYHLGKYMYDEAPVPLCAKRIGAEQIMIYFQKRVKVSDAVKAVQIIRNGKPDNALPVEVIRVDGSNILLRSSHFPPERFQLSISNIEDTPNLWLFPSKHATEAAQPCYLTVEEE
ncbi:N-acyl-D-glucosamine 2-epimerase [Paenibacillus radicis (ex Xue et al. 2023)]|uniref:N-acyl-D-glucosamine 2-epimerase n=1 Tax=Paenibacillus radicis (ex Xue et al. 2023) TaxID=2972489 RepID=A0ABT1YF10_9BACL|nr:N-acyl-D-glucosamine 2-epimerase [Paenibacillus radicis (ex Xue et al. 2023)]MCR8631778.1 N-acyl-D-glucosamine 2-epimerase [Paenibacillus radicis (ex Xue et al. 2023)]